MVNGFVTTFAERKKSICTFKIQLVGYLTLTRCVSLTWCRPLSWCQSHIIISWQLSHTYMKAEDDEDMSDDFQ